jgi:hypothetical protein
MSLRTVVVALVIALAIADPAAAAKWAGGCPRVKQKLSVVGRGTGGTAYAISRLFEHVGHDVTFYLKDADVARAGGFSTDPGGNTVEVTFTPIGGDPIALPPIAVTATTHSTLTFTFPDSRASIGRLLVGYATVAVKRGTVPLFEANRQLILPPMNDVHALTTQGASVEVLAAMDKGARVWLPLDFNGFGQNGEGLPECPTVLTPVTAFAVDFSLKKGDDQALPYVNFGQLKKNRIFLGDYLLFGLNMYGNKLQTKLDVSPSAGKDVVLCGLNDALQLVVMFQLQNPALGDNSTLLALVRDASPITVKIENVSLDPDVAARLQKADYDSAHLPCYPAP